MSGNYRILLEFLAICIQIRKPARTETHTAQVLQPLYTSETNMNLRRGYSDARRSHCRQLITVLQQ